VVSQATIDTRCAEIETRWIWSKRQVRLLSRSIICIAVAAAIGGLLIQPVNTLHYAFDVLVRTYLIFVGTVMAHEGVHGHLGTTKMSNYWWGRLALLPSMVPFTNFRKTHYLHHAHTNLPSEDPDHFMKAHNKIEIVFRAVAMPHQWFFWLWKRGRISRTDLIDLALNYVAIACVHGLVLSVVGPERFVWGMTPPLVFVSVLLWYPFALQTHEGFSTGADEFRSHNYYGRFMYWFSLGLAIHREHHLQPKLAWIELRDYVEAPPAGSKFNFFPRRDIRVEVQNR
jgi:fatty acid desaturase